MCEYHLEAELSTQEERRAHKTEVHYRGGPVPLPKSFLSLHKPNKTQAKSFIFFHSPDEHHPNPEPFFQILSSPVPSISTGLKSETQVKKAKVHSSSASRCGGTWDLDPVEFFLRDFFIGFFFLGGLVLADWSPPLP